MATALTVYPTSTNDTLLTTARQLATTAPASETSVTNKIGKSTGWDLLASQGSGNAWAAGASEPAPAGGGFILDATTLEGQQILAGTWTPKFKLKVSVGSISAEFRCRAYVRSSGGVFTLIGEWAVAAAGTGTTLSTTATVLTYGTVISAAGLTNFGVGDKLYIDWPVRIITNSTNSTTATISSFENGGTNNEQIATPGYQPQPITGSGGVTAAAAQLAGSGTETDAGSGAITVGHAALSGSGSVSSGVTGSGGITAAKAQLAASGSERVAGSGGLAAKAVHLSVSASEVFSGSGGVSVRRVSLSVSGTERISGSGGITVGHAQLAGASSGSVSGSGGVAVGRVRLSAVGTEIIGGSGSVVVRAARPSASGSELIHGSALLVVRSTRLAASGAESVRASGGVTAGRVLLRGVYIAPVTRRLYIDTVTHSAPAETRHADPTIETSRPRSAISSEVHGLS